MSSGIRVIVLFVAFNLVIIVITIFKIEESGDFLMPCPEMLIGVKCDRWEVTALTDCRGKKMIVLNCCSCQGWCH